VVAPGKYQVRLTVGDWSSTQPLTVGADPRKKATPEEYAAQFQLARSTWDMLSRTHHAIQKIRDVRTQVEALAKRLKDAGMDEGIADAAKALTGKLDAAENALHQPKSQASQDILNFPPQLDDQLANLLGVVSSAEGAPTEPSGERLAELQGQLDAQLATLDKVLATDLPAFDKLVADKQAPVVFVPKDAGTGGGG
jgi:hypothetical protein